MPGNIFVGEKAEVNQQQRIRVSRLRNEAPSGVRIVFCVTMLFRIRTIILPTRSQLKGRCLRSTPHA
jgi:hypothetical protein